MEGKDFMEKFEPSEEEKALMEKEMAEGEAIFNEIYAWMIANEETRHKVRDEAMCAIKLATSKVLAPLGILSLAMMPELVLTFKYLLYCGYMKGLRDAKPKLDIPEVWKNIDKEIK